MLFEYVGYLIIVLSWSEHGDHNDTLYKRLDFFSPDEVSKTEIINQCLKKRRIVLNVQFNWNISLPAIVKLMYSFQFSSFVGALMKLFQ